jgi:pyrimidine 5'-nucleotidase
LDLDDTLYSSESGVWEAVLERIQAYLERKLGLSHEHAETLRQRYLTQYGTTLTGLKAEFDVDVEDYLDDVHDIPIDALLSPDPHLRDMLQMIQIPKIIFSNAYLPHVERVLERLGIEQEIDHIIDIYALEFENKPKRGAYQRVLDLLSVDDPSSLVFVDDRQSNLDPAAEMNMITILVGRRPPTNSHLHIHQITDLTNLLPELLEVKQDD